MNQDKANSLARAAGASGRSYPDLCYFDEWAVPRRDETPTSRSTSFRGGRPRCTGRSR